MVKITISRKNEAAKMTTVSKKKLECQSSIQALNENMPSTPKWVESNNKNNIVQNFKQ